MPQRTTPIGGNHAPIHRGHAREGSTRQAGDQGHRAARGQEKGAAGDVPVRATGPPERGTTRRSPGATPASTARGGRETRACPCPASGRCTEAGHARERSTKPAGDEDPPRSTLRAQARVHQAPADTCGQPRLARSRASENDGFRSSDQAVRHGPDTAPTTTERDPFRPLTGHRLADRLRPHGTGEGLSAARCTRPPPRDPNASPPCADPLAHARRTPVREGCSGALKALTHTRAAPLLAGPPSYACVSPWGRRPPWRRRRCPRPGR